MDIRGDDECWPWTGCVVTKTGYGRFGWGQGREPAVLNSHRVAWELTYGPIPEGMQIDHVKARGCTRRDCCNPAHLEPVSQRENLLRGEGWGGRHSRVTHCPKGHEYTEENTMIRRKPGRREFRECRECNRNYQRSRYAKIKAEKLQGEQHEHAAV